ncbi:MAG: ferredoxin family protein [Deferrisomatales bacterium]
MRVDEKLTKNAIKPDGSSHIEIDAEACRARCRERYCVRVCPAALYEWNDEANRMVVEFAGCLECGTCLVACREGALAWRYPRGGFGVQYRYG